MSRTENFRKQHAEIMTLARQINGLLSDNLDTRAAAEIRPLLSRLAGLISLHVAMEDKTLYPGLAAHSDPAARTLGKRYQDEMGPIGAQFADYVAKWSTTAQMCAAPAQFSAHSKAIFNALFKRIHHENTELYPLLEKQAA